MGHVKDFSKRLTVVEHKMADLETLCLDQSNKITDLQLKLEDVENRSRRSNLRIRGIPETYQDATSTATALFQELAPNISAERLELDIAHRALTKIRPDGPPRDILVKCHFYLTKEMLLQNARDKSTSAPLQFQGHTYQLFADIAPATIARRREMKPYLTILQSNNIPYKWGFPFKLIFYYKSVRYSASSPDELKAILLRIGLSSTTSLKRSRIPVTPDTSLKKKPQMDHQQETPDDDPQDDRSEMT